MKIMTHKCPSCGANLKVKKGETEGICEYCETPYFIDDGVIRVEHKTTVEIKDDNYLEIAIATLENFKDYDKSEWLFKNLIHEYGHKKEIYIGIVRSITHDFKITNFESLRRLDEVNEYFEKYKSLATKTELEQYEEKVNDLNKNTWYEYLIYSTNNFNARKSSTKSKNIEYYWQQYISYCTEVEKDKLQFKYNDFIKIKKKLEKKLKKKLIILIISIISVLVAIFVIDFISLYTEKPKVKKDSIELSKVLEQIEIKNYKYFEDYLEETRSSLSIKKVLLNEKNKTVDLTIKLINRYHESNHIISIKIMDDMGAVIVDNNCTFADTEKIDVNKCFYIYDYTDGKIEQDKATVDYDEKKFISGTKNAITVSVSDKDGHMTEKNIYINITKTSAKISVKLAKYSLVEGNTTKLSYTIDPDNLPNKKVNITYDKKYVSIDKNNNVKALKKGETKICVSSEYDESEVTCVDLSISMKCKSTYTFKFSGARDEVLYGGEDFCPGRYRIYANTLNYNEAYYINVTPPDSYSSEYITIWKSFDYGNEEGKKVATTYGTKIEIDPGITQVKLVKVS